MKLPNPNQILKSIQKSYSVTHEQLILCLWELHLIGLDSR